MRQEFQPGDRVRTGNVLTGSASGIVTDSHSDDPAGSMRVNGVLFEVIVSDFTLVSRPVYPEPGQIAVALDADLLDSLPCKRFGQCDCDDDGGLNDLCAALDRAREASRP